MPFRQPSSCSLSLLLGAKGERPLFNLKFRIQRRSPGEHGRRLADFPRTVLAGTFLCVLLFFPKEEKYWHQPFEPKVMSCLPQHFKYYARVWLSVPKHSNFFSSWFQCSSVPWDPRQAREGSQGRCCVRRAPRRQRDSSPLRRPYISGSKAVEVAGQAF